MKHRRAAKVDANQNEIVAELRKLDGITVEVGHDDILVGYGGRTYWFEVKTGPRAEIKATQTKLLDSWEGHYAIVWSAQMILAAIGYAKT